MNEIILFSSVYVLYFHYGIYISAFTITLISLFNTSDNEIVKASYEA